MFPVPDTKSKVYTVHTLTSRLWTQSKLFANKPEPSLHWTHFLRAQKTLLRPSWHGAAPSTQAKTLFTSHYKNVAINHLSSGLWLVSLDHVTAGAELSLAHGSGNVNIESNFLIFPLCVRRGRVCYKLQQTRFDNILNLQLNISNM